MLSKILLTFLLIVHQILCISSHSNGDSHGKSEKRSRDPQIKRPQNGTGTILISFDDIKPRHRNDKRILIAFDLNCVNNINESDSRLMDKIAHIRERYRECLNLSNLSLTHYDTTNYSYVWMDLKCPIAIIQEKKNITINYDQLCIEYIMYEPIFWPNQTDTTATPNSTLATHECTQITTERAKGYSLDLLDSPDLNNIYSYVDIDTVRDIDTDIDLHIIDSGIQSDHIEFDETQIIHVIGDGPASIETSSGTVYDVHGTHVAGSAGGANYGSSRGFTMYDYRVCEYDDEMEVPCYTSLITDAMDRVISILKSDPSRRGVINLSLGGEKTTAMNDIYQHYFDKMIDAGGIPVVAAGNDNMDACDVSPAYSNKAITVGAFGISRRKAWFSNWGDCVDIWGPGERVYSAIPSDSNDEYGYLSGTSMAAPMIAGIVANMLIVEPTLSMDGIMNGLMNNSVSITLDECDEYECMAPIYVCGTKLYGDEWEYSNPLSLLDILLIIFGCALFGMIVTVVVLFVLKRKKKIPHTTLTDNNNNGNEEEQQAIIPTNEGAHMEDDHIATAYTVQVR